MGVVAVCELSRQAGRGVGPSNHIKDQILWVNLGQSLSHL